MKAQSINLSVICSIPPPPPASPQMQSNQASGRSGGGCLALSTSVATCPTVCMFGNGLIHH
jgi:hypothetical protein